VAYRKKLIEVALPLEAINRESAREKSLRHGHPSTLHLWWARRPLAAARAVLFASLVDDPGNDLPPDAASKERERLHRLIERLVKWENAQDEAVLHEARLEIARSIAREKGLTLSDPPTPDTVRAFLAEHAPPVLDPSPAAGAFPLRRSALASCPWPATSTRSPCSSTRP
jgi:Adenine-specific DNA methylase containing a Zn-ribbon